MSNEASTRNNERRSDEMRPVTIEMNPLAMAEGSVQISVGKTRVICSATIENNIPSWLKGKEEGWVTAEYAMLPRSSDQRIPRESVRGKQSGRTQEIQRLIGRSMRAIVDRKALGERMIILDCDVIQADGGTRTASITGAYLALAQAIHRFEMSGDIQKKVLLDSVAATSVGIVGGKHFLDLDYSEDSVAEVDMNVVMTGSGQIIEIQGTAEGAPFSFDELDQLNKLAVKGIQSLTQIQEETLKEIREEIQKGTP